MKKYLLLTLLPLAALPAQAQRLAEKQVPAVAVATLKKAYPLVRAVKWEKEAANYEAGFAQEKVETSVVISPTGTLLETETALPVAQLPAAVRARLASQYAGYKVTEAARIVTVATGATTYEAEVSRAGKKKDLLFRADGTPVQQETGDEDNKKN